MERSIRGKLAQYISLSSHVLDLAQTPPGFLCFMYLFVALLCTCTQYTDIIFNNKDTIFQLFLAHFFISDAMLYFCNLF